MTTIEAFTVWNQKRHSGEDPFTVMTPLVTRYLLTTRSIANQLAFGDIIDALRTHPVFQLLLLEDPALGEL